MNGRIALWGVLVLGVVQSPGLQAGGENRPQTLPAGRGAQPTPTSVVIKFRPGVAAAEQAALHHAYGHQVHRTIPQLDLHVVRIPPGQTAEGVVARYAHHPLVEFAEPDPVYRPALVPDDPRYDHEITPEWHLPRIDAPAAWDITTGSADVVIAILDTGVYGAHEDLASKMVAGWNIVRNDLDTSDVAGHGTLVAGQAGAASDNGIGVAAVAWGCRIMPIVITNEFAVTSGSTIAEALTWAADHGARVANISFEGVESAAVTAAAQYFQAAGGVVIKSAGNSGAFDSSPDNPYIIKVSATDQDDLVPTWSVTGNSIDLSAPGVGILTTNNRGTYSSGTGTSASAPIVSGVAALVLSANPALSAAEVQDILKQSADDYGPSGWDPAYGWGRVNASQAVLLAIDSVPSGDVSSPVVRVVAPAPADVLTGMATIVVEAIDDVGVTQVDLYCDDTLVSSDSFPPHEWVFDTTTVADGEHIFWAVAYDAADNNGESAAVSVTVDNSVPCDCPPDCGVAAAGEFPGATCDDGLDNDCDGRWDCDDPDCDTDFACVVASCNDNGVCETGEDCLGCPGDCLAGLGAACGNGVCEPGDGENCLTCPVDCNGQQGGKPSRRFCCGDGGGFGPVGCEDSRCAGDGFACSNDPVADFCCGDGVCTGLESGCDCAVDCGPSARVEVIGSTCNDTLDNDCDGVVDCDEPECADDPACPACDGDRVCELGENCVSCPTDCDGKTRSSGSSGSRLSSEYCCGNGVLEDAERDRPICDGNP